MRLIIHLQFGCFLSCSCSLFFFFYFFWYGFYLPLFCTFLPFPFLIFLLSQKVPQQNTKQLDDTACTTTMWSCEFVLSWFSWNLKQHLKKRIWPWLLWLNKGQRKPKLWCGTRLIKGSFSIIYVGLQDSFNNLTRIRQVVPRANRNLQPKTRIPLYLFLCAAQKREKKSTAQETKSEPLSLCPLFVAHITAWN